MNRKSFLRSIFGAGVAALVTTTFAFTPEDSADGRAATTIPPYLKAGDTVGITCPAGAVDVAKMQCCYNTLEKWGLNVKFGKTTQPVFAAIIAVVFAGESTTIVKTVSAVLIATGVYLVNMKNASKQMNEKAELVT